ncbi:MAG: hypothetical protein SFZ24_11315 [Planctomycetota bacterium]|nr:hypothetical protein [Planctomycetota bacterium]
MRHGIAVMFGRCARVGRVVRAACGAMMLGCATLGAGGCVRTPSACAALERHTVVLNPTAVNVTSVTSAGMPGPTAE